METRTEMFKRFREQLQEVGMWDPARNDIDKAIQEFLDRAEEEAALARRGSTQDKPYPDS